MTMADPHSRPPQRHILTVNLEDYFQVEPVARVVAQQHWHRFESRVERNTRAVLDLLDEAGQKATFFALGWIADNLPEVVAEVARRGHAVASKGYHHRSIRQMDRGEFRDDAIRSREALERASGVRVHGYRIARGWFGPEDLWALDTLAEAGFRYDSSLRPFGRNIAGHPEWRGLHRHGAPGRDIWEVPLSTARLGPWLLPISGGNYMRQLPNGAIRRAIARWDRAAESPLVLYFHIWELDPEQPRITAAPALERIRQYRNLGAMRDRLTFYLSQYRFGTVEDRLGLDAHAPAVCTERAAAAAVHPVASPGRRREIRDPVTIVVPCYNEQVTLPYLANTLARFGEAMADDYALSFVFVDDGSRDGTWDVLNRLFGGRADCALVRHVKNRGVAAATLTGISHAATQVVGVMDCDCSYDPLQFRRLLPMLTDGVDLVTASPYHREGRVMNVPAWRLGLSRGLSLLYRMVLHHKLATYTSCFRVYRRGAVAGMTLDNEGFFGIAEILGRLDLKGGHIVECPAVLEVRLLGYSKMKIVKTVLGHLGLLARLAAARWQGRMQSVPRGQVDA